MYSELWMVTQEILKKFRNRYILVNTFHDCGISNSSIELIALKLWKNSLCTVRTGFNRCHQTN